MHGTPARALFERHRRDFSHGCVRVADPVALAEWVLKDRPEWTRDRIRAATVGAVLFYTTAAVMPEDGTIHFADDIIVTTPDWIRRLLGEHGGKRSGRQDLTTLGRVRCRRGRSQTPG
jgi:hypothetical protein